MNRFYATPLFCYIVGFIFPYLLTNIKLVIFVGNYVDETHELIKFSILAHILGLAFGFVFFRFKRKDTTFELNSGVFIKVIYAWYILGIACLCLEFYQIGGIPIFMGNLENLRFELQVNGYVHLIAVTTGLTSVMLIFLSSYNIKRKSAFVQILFGIFGLLLLSLTGNRSDSGLFLVLLLVVFMFRSNIFPRIVHVLWGGILLAGFTALKFYREITSGVDYVGLIRGQMYSEPSNFDILVYPVYMTLTYNFTILDRLVKANAEALTNGFFTFHGFISLLPGSQISFGEFKNQILNEWFYAELTSTYISNFYIDFGYFGTIICCFLMAVFISLVYRLARSDERFILLYGLVYVFSLLFFYVFFYIYFSAYVYLFMALFCANFLLIKKVDR